MARRSDALVLLAMHFESAPRSLTRLDLALLQPNATTTFIADTSQTIGNLFSQIRATSNKHQPDQDAANSPYGQHGAQEQRTRV